LPDSFEYIDLESVVGTDLVSHMTESKQTAPSRAQRLARCGAVFYQTVRPYQKNNYLICPAMTTFSRQAMHKYRPGPRQEEMLKLPAKAGGFNPPKPQQ
jgi:hypothetical protein